MSRGEKPGIFTEMQGPRAASCGWTKEAGGGCNQRHGAITTKAFVVTCIHVRFNRFPRISKYMKYPLIDQLLNRKGLAPIISCSGRSTTLQIHREQRPTADNTLHCVTNKPELRRLVSLLEPQPAHRLYACKRSKISMRVKDRRYQGDWDGSACADWIVS